MNLTTKGVKKALISISVKNCDNQKTITMMTNKKVWVSISSGAWIQESQEVSMVMYGWINSNKFAITFLLKK